MFLERRFLAACGLALSGNAKPQAAERATRMSYCLGITLRRGLVMACDSRTNAGYDQVNICRKMHTFIQPGERVFIVLTSGSLSITQSVITLLRRDFE